MKRYLIVLCLLLITHNLLFASFQIGDLWYEQIDNTRTVRIVRQQSGEYYSIPSPYILTIPSKIKYNGITYKVTEIAEQCFAESNIVQLIIPEGFKSIPRRMMFNSMQLRTVTLPSSIEIVGGEAFSECKALETVEFSKIPQHEIVFGGGSFDSCLKIKNFPFSKLNIKTIGGAAFCLTGLTHFEINGTPTIGNCAFQDCKNLRTITFYSNVGGIGKCAFMGCPIDTIYSYSETPNDLCAIDVEPLAPYERFIVDDKIYKNKTVVVPEDCIDAYKARLGWRVFWNYLDILETGVHSVKAQAQSLKVSSPSSCALRVSGLKPNETVRCYTTTGNLLCEYKAKSNEANLTLPVFSGNIVIVKAGTRSAKVRMR